MLQRLEKGSFGQVSHVKHRLSGECQAIKEVKIGLFNQTMINREVTLIKEARHVGVPPNPRASGSLIFSQEAVIHRFDAFREDRFYCK